MIFNYPHIEFADLHNDLLEANIISSDDNLVELLELEQKPSLHISCPFSCFMLYFDDYSVANGLSIYDNPKTREIAKYLYYRLNNEEHQWGNIIYIDNTLGEDDDF